MDNYGKKCYQIESDSTSCEIIQHSTRFERKPTTIHDLCCDIWEHIFEYFEIPDLFTTFPSITNAVDQVLYNEYYKFFLSRLKLDHDEKVPQQIPLNRVISLTLNQTVSFEVLQHCLELRSLKLIGENEWITEIMRNIRGSNTKLNQLTVVTPTIVSTQELLIPILSISSLRRLEIHIDEIVESRQVSTLITIPSEIEQFIFDSGSTISWNDFSREMPNFIRIRFLSIGLLDRNQKPIPADILQNVRTLNLGLLEVPFNWIIQLVATASCLVKLKLTGLVDAGGFVVNQRWICLFELASTLLRVFVNVSLQQSDESYQCEKIQAPLSALQLSLTCTDDDTDGDLLCYKNVNRWWNLKGMIIKQ